MDEQDQLALLAGIAAGGYVAMTFTALFFMPWSRLIQTVKAVFYIGSAVSLAGFVFAVLLQPVGAFLGIDTIEWALYFLIAQCAGWLFALATLGEAIGRAKRGEPLRPNGTAPLHHGFEEIRGENATLRRRLAEMQIRMDRLQRLQTLIYDELSKEPSLRQSLDLLAVRLTAILEGKVEEKMEEVKEVIEDTVEGTITANGETDSEASEGGEINEQSTSGDI